MTGSRAEAAALRAEALRPIEAERQAYFAAEPGPLKQEAAERIDRLMPPAKRDAVSKKIGIKCGRIRAAHVRNLVSLLGKRPVYEQIGMLNAHVRRLRNQGLIGGGLPRRINREAVEHDYYWCHYHPKLRPDEAITNDLVFNAVCGGDTARSFARPEIPDEWLALQDIAHELAALPSGGPQPTPVWAALCDYHERVETPSGPRMVRRNRLRCLLEAEFKRCPKALHQALAGLLRAHLRFLLFSPRRARRSRFKNAKTLALVCHRIAGKTADKARPSEQKLRDLHRAARRDRCLRNALRQFFFPGVTWDALLNNRPLLGKMLRDSVPGDVQHLLSFLLMDRPQKPTGLILHWLKIHEPGSDHRRDFALASGWSELAAAKQAGKNDAELMGEVAKIAGIPVAEAGKEVCLENLARRRLRLGLRYPC